MSAPEMWRLVDGRGGVREVPVRVEGGLLLVGPGPQPRYFASEEPPRLALMHYAMSMRWPIAEILAPGERTRSEALVDRQHFRDLLAVIHRDGGHYLAQHGVERACFDGARRVLYDREALVMVERERDSARSDCGVMSHLHGERSEELIAAKRDLAAERARCAAVCRARAEKHRKTAAEETAAAEYGEALESGVIAREADACAEAIVRGAGGLVTGGAARRVRAAGVVAWKAMEGGR